MARVLDVQITPDKVDHDVRNLLSSSHGNSLASNHAGFLTSEHGTVLVLFLAQRLLHQVDVALLKPRLTIDEARTAVRSYIMACNHVATIKAHGVSTALGDYEEGKALGYYDASPLDALLVSRKQDMINLANTHRISSGLVKGQKPADYISKTVAPLEKPKAISNPPHSAHHPWKGDCARILASAKSVIPALQREIAATQQALSTKSVAPSTPAPSQPPLSPRRTSQSTISASQPVVVALLARELSQEEKEEQKKWDETVARVDQTINAIREAEARKAALQAKESTQREAPTQAASVSSNKQASARETLLAAARGGATSQQRSLTAPQLPEQQCRPAASSSAANPQRRPLLKQAAAPKAPPKPSRWACCFTVPESPKSSPRTKPHSLHTQEMRELETPSGVLTI